MDDQLALYETAQLVSTTAVVIFGGPIILSAGTLLALLQLPGPAAVVAGLKVLSILLPIAGGLAEKLVTYAGNVFITLVTFATLVVESPCSTRCASPEPRQTLEKLGRCS